MTKKIVFDLKGSIEKRAFVVDEHEVIHRYYFHNMIQSNIQGNIYIAKIVYVDFNLRLAFVDYGAKKNGFISFDDISEIYLSNNFIKHFVQFDLSKAKYTDEILEHYCEKLEGSDKEVPVVSKNISVKPGQYLVVQAIKNETDTKGATFSTKIILNTKHFVFAPFNNGVIGISKSILYIRSKIKIALNEIFKDVFCDNIDVGFIFRSSGVKMRIKDLIEDLSSAIEIWNDVVNNLSKEIKLIYNHDNFFNDIIYESSNLDIKQIITNDKKSIKVLSEYEIPVVYQDIDLYTYDQQVLSLYSNYVYLKSGGFLVIQKTEALYSIDINSGNMSSKVSLHDLNKEAAYESARQIKLRDMTGIIIIDFIENKDPDMMLKDILQKELSDDKSKVKVFDMNALGLISLSRQRKMIPFLDLNNIQCKMCLGKGFIRGNQVVYMFKIIENELLNISNIKSVTITVNSIFLENIFNLMRDKVSEIEKTLNIQINFAIDSSLPYERFVLNYEDKVILRYDGGQVVKKQSFFSKIMNKFL